MKVLITEYTEYHMRKISKIRALNTWAVSVAAPEQLQKGDDVEAIRALSDGDEIPTLNWASNELPGNLW